MAARTSVQAFFDENTWTVTYVVVDDATRAAAIIDPVLDFDFKSGRTTTVQADKVVAYVRDHGLRVEWILETHAHADHLSGARDLQRKVGDIHARRSGYRVIAELVSKALPKR